MTKRILCLLLTLITVFTLAAPAYAEAGTAEVIAPVTAAAKLSAPKLKSVENSTGGIKITWGEVYGAEKYRIY